MKVLIYANGIVSCSVCAEDGMSTTEIENAVNIQNPTGIHSQWRVSEDLTFADGTKHPTDCEKVKGRSHYLLTC